MNLGIKCEVCDATPVRCFCDAHLPFQAANEGVRHPVFTPPFSIYHNGVEIGDVNGHVCTAEDEEIAKALVEGLNRAFPREVFNPASDCPDPRGCTFYKACADHPHCSTAREERKTYCTQEGPAWCRRSLDMASRCSECPERSISSTSREEQRCECGACRADDYQHSSGCAVHNAPAFPIGKCDCRTASLPSTERGDAA